MTDLIKALKFYEKQSEDLRKASEKNCIYFRKSTPKRRAALSRKVAICSEAKEKAFWYVVGIMMESEFYKPIRDVDGEKYKVLLENIRTALGRYPSFFQGLNGEHLK